MNAILDAEGDPRERTLLVLLPPAFGTARDFFDHGFVAALRTRHPAVDVAAADALADHYLDQSVVEQLHAGVIAPARARGYRRLWLGGISIGGFGSLLYLERQRASVDGLILLAPYLGSRLAVNEVLRAGGFEAWNAPPPAHDDHERALLAWLKTALQPGSACPPIYLGHGLDDRFAPSIALLAAALPQERVVRMPGGHDWPTWRRLWDALLDRSPFGPETLC